MPPLSPHPSPSPAAKPPTTDKSYHIETTHNSANNMADRPKDASNSSEAFATLFADLHSYAKAEAEVNQEQWEFTRRCTAHVLDKFSNLQHQAVESLDAVEENKSLIARLPAEFGAQLDELDKHLGTMETVVQHLDEYSLALERRFLAQ